MDKAREYSLWLMPKGSVREKLEQIISRFSRQYGTPFFDPHVTLLGGLTDSEKQLIDASRELAHQLQPYTIQLTDVAFLDEFYRSLFARVQETEPVMNAHARARQIFHHSENGTYAPHLSLMYGNLTPTTKQQIVEAIGILDLRFQADSIHLVSTLGETTDWYYVGEFEL